MIRPDYITKWKRTIPITPHFEDDALLVYQIGSFKTDDFELIAEPIPNLGALDIAQSATCQNPSGVLGLDVAWGVKDGSLKPAQLNVQLRLNDEDNLISNEIQPLTSLNLQQRQLSF